ncbi:UNVERIFIED_CONTAM: putative LRR receptor-like serine/threonine-protein kinase [Sesamum radiatum]|uniref:non-specific serine/threonine protein kinase n=1 Tax=Sesamum radiatum TaxID=300843 RepID=A0AAW2SJN3_SESRA
MALYDTEVFGSIPSELGLCSELRNLYLHMNKLTGSIPPELGKLQKLTSMLLWGNSLSGSIPPELSNCSSLVVLDVSANDLSGEIPGDLGKLDVLEQLHLSDNALTGSIPWRLSNCTSLIALQLDKNQLSGPIPGQIGELKNLQSFFLWGNSVSGTIPPEFGNCTELYALDLSRNKLTGSIPEEVFGLKKLSKLLLLGEFLNRGIATQCSKMSVSCELLDKLILNNNLLTGAIPKSIRNLQKITLLDLSFNSFSGPIPPEIGYLTSLTISLDLKANRFIGEIPETMSGLTQLQSLDLSSNLLYGRISVLSVLTSLTFLNVSCNNFSGPIPVTPFFHTLTMNSFLENPHLCQSLDGSTCSSRLMRRNGLKSAKTIALVAVILISVTMAVVATWIIVARNHKYVIEKSGMPSSSTEEDFSYPWTFIPFQKLNFSIENILNCLRDENVIGKGCSGVVYKAEMPNGELVAVKKLWRTKKDEEPIDSFAAEIQILGHIRHRNIVKLLGYCSNKSVKLLLYNFIPNGNLQQLLQNNRNLDWETRYKIAVGSAQGLAYLHHDCLPTILHRDVKCNNILLDSKYEAYLADFGLAKLMNSPNYQQAMSRVAGSYGYIAPGKCLLNFLITVFNQDCFPVIWFLTKYGYTVNITEKSDVYSYGVVLLEILSGRSAVEPQIGDGLHIVEWVRRKWEALNRLYQYSTQNSKACRINWCKKCSKLSESLCFV